MEVICLENDAFHAVIDNVLAYVKTVTQKEDKWLSTKQAVQCLHIKSKLMSFQFEDTDTHVKAFLRGDSDQLPIYQYLIILV
jgi:hypothetical protein